MAWYEIGFTTTAVAANSPLAAFRAPTRTSRIWEIGWSCSVATASSVTVFDNTNASYAASVSTAAGQQTNPLWANGTSLVDTAWTSAPTITPAKRMRRGQLPASVGAQWVFTFRDGLWVRSATPTDIIILWNESAAANSILNGYFVWEE